MAKVEFSVAWWKKNAAKTLTDTGMSEALREWEKTKTSDDKILKALDSLAAAALRAEIKGSKTLHKDTIVLLKEYQKQCKDFKIRLAKADEESLSLDQILNKPMLDIIAKSPKSRDSIDSLLYLFTTKGKPDEANQKIFDIWFKTNGKYALNIPGRILDKCNELAEAGIWKDSAWAEARKEARRMAMDNLSDIQKSVLTPIAREPVLREIRAA